MGKVSSQKELVERRAQVAELLTRGVPQVEMARRLGVSRNTIARDIKATLTKVADTLDGRTSQFRARDVQVLDFLDAVAQTNMENAYRKRQQLEEVDQKGEKSVAWERYDRSMRAWYEERLRVQERRAKLLNLDVQQPQAAVTLSQPITFILDSREVEKRLDSGNGHEDVGVIDGEVIVDGS